MKTASSYGLGCLQEQGISSELRKFRCELQQFHTDKVLSILRHSHHKLSTVRIDFPFDYGIRDHPSLSSNDGPLFQFEYSIIRRQLYNLDGLCNHLFPVILPIRNLRSFTLLMM